MRERYVEINRDRQTKNQRERQRETEKKREGKTETATEQEREQNRSIFNPGVACRHKMPLNPLMMGVYQNVWENLSSLLLQH